MQAVPWIIASLCAVGAGILLRRRASRTAAFVWCFVVFAAAWVVSDWVIPDAAPRRRPDSPEIARGDEAKDRRGFAPPDVRAAQLEIHRPVAVASDGYVSSATCQTCHPDNHASWYGSYHRTMTQVATTKNVLGDFDDVHLTVNQHHYHLQQKNDVCWVSLDNPDAPPLRIDAPIVMTTGSHHMQVYWYGTGHTRLTGQLPLVYLKEADRWIPRDAAFLAPPAAEGSETGRWNETCVGCHATHGRPRPTSNRGWDTQVAEFGISCEACHGPGQRHVQSRLAAGPSPDPQAGPQPNANTHEQELPSGEIVNPVALPHHRASQVCGQCHSVSSALDPEDFRQALNQGYSYRPGADLNDHRVVIRDDPRGRRHLAKYVDDAEAFLKDRFWSDGMIRIAGREFNGLIESSCYQQGQLSCFSCHQLHRAADDSRSMSEWADDQLRPIAMGDRACLQCHQADMYGQKHSHHDPSSAGARCYNCHMPHTTYGLLKAIRSHQISVPDVGRDRRAGRPNACNLCHLDQTLQWSADHLRQWHGSEPPPLSEEEKTTAASVLWLLKGDAGTRALAAWSAGWAPAQEASGVDWQAPLLAELLEDPYQAVRYIAARSLRSLPGFASLDYDFVGSAEHRNRARRDALQRWGPQEKKLPPSRPEILIRDGHLDQARLRELLQQRDDRPVNLVE